MPDWPRGLSEPLAALYVGVSVTKFRDEVKNRVWPEGERRGGRIIYDKELLDRAFDKRSGIVETSIDLDAEFEIPHGTD